MIDFNSNNTDRRACNVNYFVRIIDLKNHKTQTLCHNGIKHRVVTVTSGNSVKIFTPQKALKSDNFVISARGKFPLKIPYNTA